jgi:hypothetical protein
MQTTLRVEWTALHYIFPDSIASPVGNITPLLKAGEMRARSLLQGTHSYAAWRIVVSLAALFVIDVNDTKESGEWISEGGQQNSSTAKCPVPYLLIDDGSPVWSVCEPILWEAVRVTFITSSEMLS